MAVDCKKSLIAFSLCLLTAGTVSTPAAAAERWGAAKRDSWTERSEVDGDASHLIERNSFSAAVSSPVGAEIRSASTPGKAYQWQPLRHHDGLGGYRILASGVFNDLSGCWFAERIGKAPGPYATLFVTADNYSWAISGGRFLADRLVVCSTWNSSAAGWITATAFQDKDRPAELLFVPFAENEEIIPLPFEGKEAVSMAALPDGSVWISDTDGRVWYSADILRGWPFECIAASPGEKITLAPAASGRYVFAVLNNTLTLFDTSGKQVSSFHLPADITVKEIVAADGTSALLIADDGRLYSFAGGTVRNCGEYAITAAWQPERKVYMVALSQKQYLQLLDIEGNLLDVKVKCKAGQPELLLPLPGEDFLVFSIIGKFNRITPTRRSLRFTPVFGSSD